MDNNFSQKDGSNPKEVRLIPKFGSRKGLQTYSPKQILQAGGIENFAQVVGYKPPHFEKIEMTEEEYQALLTMQKESE